jgi:hypothetical protein
MRNSVPAASCDIAYDAKPADDELALCTASVDRSADNLSLKQAAKLRAPRDSYWRFGDQPGAY